MPRRRLFDVPGLLEGFGGLGFGGLEVLALGV